MKVSSSSTKIDAKPVLVFNVDIDKPFYINKHYSDPMSDAHKCIFVRPYIANEMSIHIHHVNGRVVFNLTKNKLTVIDANLEVTYYGEQKKDVFKPFDLTISIENKEEAARLYSLFNTPTITSSFLLQDISDEAKIIINKNTNVPKKYKLSQYTLSELLK